MKATFYTIFPVSSAITTNSWVSSIYAAELTVTEPINQNILQ